ncbi:MAG: hypothetical protein KF718_21275 [Polyangiaceae bacterium]|nr:hypothetical protein [Polyangiaceae bacterium]
MSYRVFSQRSEPRLPFADLLNQARRFFEARLEVEGESGFAPGQAPLATHATLRIASARLGFDERVRVHARPRSAMDLADAQRAEVRGRAAGMATLAARCPTVWELAEDGPTEVVLLCTSGLLASVALGPVLPPDGSTLFGVRGAMERVDLLSGGRTLLR